MKLKTWINFLFDRFRPIKNRQQTLDDEDKASMKRAVQVASLYEIPEGQDILDITDKLLESSWMTKSAKNKIRRSKRRFFVFIYPSDGLRIKGFVSFITNSQAQPLIYQIRGGNKMLGLPNPASDLALLGDCSVVGTTLRDGVSEGKDEFGGSDVNDIKNLMEFIPELEKMVDHSLQNPKEYMVAYSRGGMEMFLLLGRFPHLQRRISKVVSMSGLLDIRFCMEDRADMKEMFIKDFGLNDKNQEEWIFLRDPLLTVHQIQKDLPILIVQGTNDLRIPLNGGLKMVGALKNRGCKVEYWEIKGGDHCLYNQKNISKLIIQWLVK